jgi:hypothetical protein
MLVRQAAMEDHCNCGKQIHSEGAEDNEDNR